jgi:hypothetical protein
MARSGTFLPIGWRLGTSGYIDTAHSWISTTPLSRFEMLDDLDCPQTVADRRKQMFERRKSGCKQAATGKNRCPSPSDKLLGRSQDSGQKTNLRGGDPVQAACRPLSG